MNLLLSIIIPCHNEENNILPLYEEVKQSLAPLDYELEFIFVDDGSTDGTLNYIKSLREKDKRVQVISFMTNYGHQNAVMEGLRSCRGDLAVSLDADLQQHPKYIPLMLEKQQATCVEIVDAKRHGKQKGFIKNFFSKIFYSCFSLVTGLNLEPGVSDFRLYTRFAIDVLCTSREQFPFLRGMISDMRIPKTTIDYDLAPRHADVPSYTFKKSLNLAYTSLLNFSSLPYRLGITSAIMFICFSVSMLFYYLYNRLFTSNYIEGNTDIIIMLSGGFGITIFIVALILRQQYIFTKLIKEKLVFKKINTLEEE